jgi:hypothetical protein
MIGPIVFVLTGLILGVLGVPGAFGAAAAPVLTARSDTVNIGDAFIIAFDPTLVKALGFTDIGADFATAASHGGGFPTGLTGFIDNTTGTLSSVAASMSGLATGTGLTPGGVDIDVQASAIGVSPLVLSNAFLTDNRVPLSSANSDLMLQNGRMAVPEASTLLLLSFALGGLAQS